MDDFRQRILDWAKSEGLDRPPRKARQKRRKPSLSDKLAAVLLLLSNADGSPMIPVGLRDTKEAILAVPLQWDHIIALGLEGPDAFHNLRPLSIGDHKPKTKADKVRMAHNNRLRKTREDRDIASFVNRVLAPTPKAEVIPFPKSGRHPPKRGSKKIAKGGKHYRPMPGGRDSKYKRTMRHGVVLREKRP